MGQHNNNLFFLHKKLLKIPIRVCWQIFFRLLASAGRDGTIRIWDTIQGTSQRILSGHTASVTCIRWGGTGLIYSASQDCTVRVWRAEDGVLCRQLSGHAHWVNTLALNVDYILRTSCFEAEKYCQPPAGDATAVIFFVKHIQI